MAPRAGLRRSLAPKPAPVKVGLPRLPDWSELNPCMRMGTHPQLGGGWAPPPHGASAGKGEERQRATPALGTAMTHQPEPHKTAGPSSERKLTFGGTCPDLSRLLTISSVSPCVSSSLLRWEAQWRKRVSPDVLSPRRPLTTWQPSLSHISSQLWV